jgi:hypothetical protein
MRRFIAAFLFFGASVFGASANDGRNRGGGSPPAGFRHEWRTRCLADPWGAALGVLSPAVEKPARMPADGLRPVCGRRAAGVRRLEHGLAAANGAGGAECPGIFARFPECPGDLENGMGLSRARADCRRAPSSPAPEGAPCLRPPGILSFYWRADCFCCAHDYFPARAGVLPECHAVAAA